MTLPSRFTFPLLGFLLLAGATPSPTPAAETGQAPLAVEARGALEAAARQYEWLAAHLPADGTSPRSFEHGSLRTVANKDWTAGFFPGSLWYLFEATGDAKWKSLATQYTAKLAREKDNRGTHDVGFILNSSYGNALRLTGDPADRAVLLAGAASLSTRFNPTVGSIKSWDRPPTEYTFPVIIDNLMNLELLTSAARLAGTRTGAKSPWPMRTRRCSIISARTAAPCMSSTTTAPRDACCGASPTRARATIPPGPAARLGRSTATP